MLPKLLSYYGNDWGLLCMSNNPGRMIVIDCEFSDFSYYADELFLEFDMENYNIIKKRFNEFPMVSKDQSYATMWTQDKLYPVEIKSKIPKEDIKFLNLEFSLEDMKEYPIRKYPIF